MSPVSDTLPDMFGLVEIIRPVAMWLMTARHFLKRSLPKIPCPLLLPAQSAYEVYGLHHVHTEGSTKLNLCCALTAPNCHSTLRDPV